MGLRIGRAIVRREVKKNSTHTLEEHPGCIHDCRPSLLREGVRSTRFACANGAYGFPVAPGVF